MLKWRADAKPKEWCYCMSQIALTSWWFQSVWKEFSPVDVSNYRAPKPITEIVHLKKVAWSPTLELHTMTSSSADTGANKSTTIWPAEVRIPFGNLLQWKLHHICKRISCSKRVLSIAMILFPGGYDPAWNTLEKPECSRWPAAQKPSPCSFSWTQVPQFQWTFPR